MTRRGEIVIVDFRSTNPRAGVRPTLVVQNYRDNARMSNTIVAQITTTIRRAIEDTQHSIDATHPDWATSGLRRPSVVNCSNVYTNEQKDVARVIGTLTAATMQQIEACLKAAFALS